MRQSRHPARRAFTMSGEIAKKQKDKQLTSNMLAPSSFSNPSSSPSISFSLTIKHSQYGGAESPENYGYGVAANYGRARRRTSDRDA